MITSESRDAVTVITIDREERRNALNVDHLEQLSAAVERAVAGEARAVVITGAGSSFCSGADFDEVYAEGFRDALYRTLALIRDAAMPVIAAVNGPAIGAGFVLMLACDIMLASDNAYFSMPEINVGLAGGARFLMEHVGRSRARMLYFTGRRVSAAELYRLGVIEACPPREELMAAALEIARDIAGKSPLAIRHVKRALNTIEELPVRDAYRFEQSVTVELSHTEDAREAQRAFVEKRKPVFKGK